MPDNNATRKAERRAKLAEAKAARNAAGVNMFNPSVTKRTVNIGTIFNANPLNTITKLRAPNLFRGQPSQKFLTPKQIKQIQLLGLPTSNPQPLTSKEWVNLNAIARENAENTMATKRASMNNGPGLSGDQYLYDTVYPKTQTNLNELASHRAEELLQTVPDATRRLRAKAKYLRYTMGNERAAQQALRDANAIKAGEAYLVAEPTARSLANAEAYHRFAQNHYAGRFNTVEQPIQVEPPRQSSPGFFGGLFRSCFGESCDVNTSATVNPLYGHGGRSRRKYRMRKSRNKRKH